MTKRDGKKDIEKTAFVTHHGLLKYSRMPLGIKNVTKTFQRGMHVILALVKWHYAIVYINDIIVFSKSPKQHLQHIVEVLLLFCDVCTTIKLKNCFFLSKKTIDYLGHVITSGKQQVTQKITEVIERLQYRTIISELRSFLGFFNAY